MNMTPEKVHSVELLPENAVLIASRRWDSNGARLCVATEGQTLEAMIRQAVERAYPGRDERFYELALGWCRARVDGVEMRRIHWGEVRPVAGQRVEVLVAPEGGGGGKKNPLAAVLSLVVTVVAVAFQQYYLVPALTKAGLTATMATAVGAGITAAVVGIAGMAINALFPVSMPTASLDNSGENSQTYSLNGGQNSANPNGYVPLVLGKYRMTPPLGAKSWTSYEGEDQYFHMLVVWGHAGMKVTDFRIGETPLSSFDDVTHVFHGSTTGKDLRLFGKSYNEQSVGAALKNSEGWVERSIGEADEISFDISFPALGKANKKKGNIESYSVGFHAQCALEGTENWQGIGRDSFVVRGASATFSGRAKYLDVRVWTDMNGNVSIADGSAKPTSAISVYPTKDYRISGCDVKIVEEKYREEQGAGDYTVTRYRTIVTVSSGSVGAGSFTISGSQTSPLVRSFRSAVPHGKWKVRIRRASADTDDNYIYDDATWSTVRAVVNRAPFSTPVPVCCSELRIRASEQLSGYVSDFNGLAQSVVPDWNGEEWEEQATSNPASLLRYCLTSRHGSYTPYSEAKLDEESFVAFHEHCAKEGFSFNFVCDTETLTWKRMVQIAAAGRAAVTFDNDGLVSVVIDRAGKEPVQMFTTRNSWGFSVDRAYARYPHALRAKFRNEAGDYKEENGYVYADGYNASNATNIVEWEAEGKTNWGEVWRFGRYYLASARLRPESVTLSTDWEWRMCRRGDLVLVSHDVLTNTFGSARIVGLLYDVDGDTVTVASEASKPEGLLPVGVVLDDSVIFSEPAPACYGIAVRQNTGRVLTYEVSPQYGEESNELFFQYGLNSAQVPPLGALASVALFASSGETEIGQYLVAGITPGDNASADLTLIPYAPEIMDADTGSIPSWNPPVRLPTIPKRDSLPVPQIKEIRTDESVLVRSGDSLLSRIAAWYRLPSSPDASLGEIQVQMQAKDDFGNVFTASAPLTDPFVAVQGVEDGRQYKVILRLVSSRGVAGEWSTAHTVAVEGKSAPPLPPENVTVRIDDPRGLTFAWEPAQVLDIREYEVRGVLSGRTSGTSLTLEPWRLTGDHSFSVVAVDVLGLESEAVSASVTILPPAAPAIRSAQLLDEGIVAQWASSKTSWSIDRYDVKSGDASVSSSGLRAVVPVSVPFAEGSVLTVQARDVFGNWSETSEAEIAVYPPKAPAVTLGYDPLSGKLTVDWQDCQNDVPGAPSIARYDVSGTLANQQSSSGVVSVQGTHYEALVPLTAYEYGAQADEDGIEVQVGTVTVYVTAVDKWGVETQGKEAKLSIWPPYNPTRMALSASEEGDSIVLSWRDCKRTCAIDHYLVYDSWTKQSYKVAANYVVLPARPEGEYSVTVQAVDIIGNASASMPYVMRVGGVGGMDVTARVDGADILLEWSIPDSTFVLDHYVIMRDNDELPTGGAGDALLDGFLGTAKVNFFRVPAGSVGSYVYYVWAVDVAGNVSTSYASFAAVAIEEPSAPVVTAELEGEGVGLHWQASVGAAQLPIRAWDVVRQFDAADGQAGEQDYGRLDVDTTTVPAFASGQHTFLVRGVDSGGNVGPWGYVDFMAVPPGRVTFGEPTVIDNNVHLYWSQPSRIFFPIREYIFTEEEVYEDGTQYSMEIGRVDALFANQTEEIAGTCTYGVTPVDMGGNVGEKTVITLRVSSPQGFKFFGRVDSLFNGAKDGFVLDGRGAMLGPVPDAETWDENVERVAGLTGLDAATLTHEQKADAGYATWLEPRIAQAVYVETTDHGALVPSSSISVSVTRQTLEGEPELTCRIEVSQDGVDWELVSDNAFTVYATSFQYSRVTLTVTGGYVRISGIVIDLNIKQLTDYGRSKVYAADEGGTFIPFGVSFVDVNSLPKPNVLNVEGAEAFTNFVRELNPQGFRAYVLDGNNDRIDAEIDWVAYGV